MFSAHSQVIHDVLKSEARIEPTRLEALQAEQRSSGRSFADVVVEAGVMEKPALLAAIADHVGCEYLMEMPERFPVDAVATLTRERARSYGVMPFRLDADGLDLLVLNPFKADLADDLTFVLGRRVRVFLADPERVESEINRHYGEDQTALADLVGEIQAPDVGDDAEIPLHDLESLAGQPPVIRFVNLVLGQAVRDRASDIHFEPFEQEFKIRYRIDGTLHELTPPPRALAVPITSRLKVLANLNIAERRVPQDGRIQISLGGRPVDLRVSTLPTQFGESVVLRVLDQGSARLELAELGLPPEILTGVNEIIRRPHGIFVVTGPTGSGKTTTLYSGLNAINATGLKILTAEDPVEYEIEGLMQVPVNPGIGLTFASALRSFLRQDPDVIMVGEIRDPETAQISIQAALTGHLVLSTLHTNDAPGAITRFIDMGVEPFLIASTLQAVLAQRLLRRICAQCRTPVEPSQAVLAQLHLPTAASASGNFFQGRGCAHCDQTGYKGRIGIYEWLPISEALRELIVQRAPALELKEKAVSEGLRTLREDGLRAIFAGETTVEEVVKYT